MRILQIFNVIYQNRAYKVKKVKRMSKTESLYEELLRRRVLRFDEIVEIARNTLGEDYSRSYINTKYVQQLVKAGRLERVRRGLYVALSPIEDKPQVDKLLIASKIRTDYYLGYHTALELHGCAYSAHNETYTCVRPKGRFTPFTFHNYIFKPVFTDDLETVIEEKDYRGHSIRVSSKERTFIECLDRVGYAGGWEEALKSLENLGGLKFEKIRRYAIQTGKQILIRKTGFILELLKKSSMFYEHLPESTLKEIEEGVHGAPTYLIRNLRGPLNPRWSLYVPTGFEEKLRGV